MSSYVPSLVLGHKLAILLGLPLRHAACLGLLARLGRRAILVQPVLFRIWKHGGMEFIAVKRYLSEVRVAGDFTCLSHPAPLLPVVSWAQKDVRFSDVNDHTGVKNLFWLVSDSSIWRLGALCTYPIDFAVKAGFRDSDAKYGSGFTLYFDVKPGQHTSVLTYRY